MLEQLQDSWGNMIDQLAGWLDKIIINLPNLLLAMVIMLLAYIVALRSKKWTMRIFQRIVREESVRHLLANFFFIAILSIGFLLSVAILNLDTFLKSLLAGAGIMGLAVGLALQGTLSNTFSGIFLAVKDVISVGDYIITNGYAGKVIEIDLRNTKLKESDNNIVVIPNKQVLETPFKNFGLTQRMRVSVECGVGYDADLHFVQKIVTEALLQRFPQVQEDNFEFYYREFGDHAIAFMVRFYVKATKNRSNLKACSDAILTIKDVLDANNITIPFPIRTVYLEQDGRPSPTNGAGNIQTGTEVKDQ